MTPFKQVAATDKTHAPTKSQWTRTRTLTRTDGQGELINGLQVCLGSDR